MKNLIERKMYDGPSLIAGVPKKYRGTRAEALREIEKHIPFKITDKDDGARRGDWTYFASMPNLDRFVITVSSDGKASFTAEINVDREKNIAALGKTLKKMGFKK